MAILLVSLWMSAQEAFAPATVEVAANLVAEPQFGRRRQPSSPEEKQQERDRIKALNKERQQKLKEDTDKLLALATQLKEYVDKTNENLLSLDVVKKADEIEKLAKSVREKMK